MILEPVDSYKGHDIYRNLMDESYIVYNVENNLIAREAVRLFVQNDIDINMKLFSIKTTQELAKIDIDYDIRGKR